MRKMDFILLVVFLLLLAFIAAMVVTFWRYQAVPDSLITAVLGTGGLELAASAAIKIWGDK